MDFKNRRVAHLALALAGGLLLAGAQGPDDDLFQGLDVAVPHRPALAGGDNDRRLRYELHLTNFARAPWAVSAVELLDAATGRLLLRLDGPALDAALGVAGGEGGPRHIAPGQRNIIYVDYVDARLTDVAPRSVRHRIVLDRDGAARAIATPELPLDPRPLPILGPPLRGGPWVAVYDPAMERGHRRVVYAVRGVARIPGRHAIDWMAAPEMGNDGAGAEVLAVADAVVTAARDSFPDPVPGAPPQDRTLADAAGNYIALRLADGRFAVYEHLAAGLRVRLGERVRKGQVIARLGATGQASRPHLHFHLGDSPEPLTAEGLPYLIEGYRRLGRFDSIEAFGASAPWRREPVRRATRAFPSPNVVVRFP